MADTFDNGAAGATMPPGQFPDDPGAGDWSEPLGPQPPAAPERPAKLPLFRPPEAGAPYPVDALPELLKEAVEAIADLTQCDPAIAANSVLGACALAVQAHADVVLPHGAVVPTSLYLVTIADSGDRKSAADDWAMEAVQEAEAAGQEARRAAWGDYKRGHDAWAEIRAAILKDRKLKGDRAAMEAALKAVGDEPRAPLDPSIVVSEPTIAGLEKTFQTGRPALGLFSDEGGQMLGGHAMRDESRLHAFTALNNLWQGKPIKRTRAGDGNALLLGRRLSLHLMIQPGIAPKLLGAAEAKDTGHVARLLVVAPPSRPGERLFRLPSPASKAALARFNERLAELLAAWPHHADDLQRLEPRQLDMTAGARSDWIAFHDACQERVRDGAGWESIRAWGEKAPEQAGRLAGVLAIMVDPKAEAIDLLSMQQAIRLVEHYGAEVARLAGQPMLDPKLLKAHRLLQWAKQQPGSRFSVSRAMQFGPVREPAKQMHELCELLKEHGELQPLPDGLVFDGRRHKAAWRVVPD